MDETEKEDGEMAKDALLLLLLLLLVVGVAGSVCPLLLGGRMHDAKAAKWRGKHPCRDSLIPAASGYISTSNKMKRQTSMNGSSVEWDPELPLAARSYSKEARRNKQFFDCDDIHESTTRVLGTSMGFVSYGLWRKRKCFSDLSNSIYNYDPFNCPFPIKGHL